LAFKPGVAFSDSTVYYWRVARIPASNEELKWNDASFIYLSNSDLGFNQSHYFQHLNSATSRISLDTISRAWKFDPSHSSITINNTVYPTGGAQQLDFYVLV